MKLFVEQPELHWVCYISSTLYFVHYDSTVYCSLHCKANLDSVLMMIESQTCRQKDTQWSSREDRNGGDRGGGGTVNRVGDTFLVRFLNKKKLIIILFLWSLWTLVQTKKVFEWFWEVFGSFPWRHFNPSHLNWSEWTVNQFLWGGDPFFT